jgi:transcriptional regulator with XRE-family HTH domain
MLGNRVLIDQQQRASRTTRLRAGPTRITDIRSIVETAVAGFDGNQAALAVELGVTRATVSRWMSGQSIPDEGSCLRLAKITGRAAADVFRLAGRDSNHLLSTEPELMADAEMSVRLRQWARRLGELSADERAVAMSVLDGVVKSLCQGLGQRSGHELQALDGLGDRPKTSGRPGGVAVS